MSDVVNPECMMCKVAIERRHGESASKWKAKRFCGIACKADAQRTGLIKVGRRVGEPGARNTGPFAQATHSAMGTDAGKRLCPTCGTRLKRRPGEAELKYALRAFCDIKCYRAFGSGRRTPPVPVGAYDD